VSNPSILVVDDEPIILHTLIRAIRALFPHAAIDAATDGDTAERAIHGHAYSLLITDYYLGTTTGAQLAAYAKALRPDLAVLLLSGDVLPQENAQSPEVDAFVRKPFELADLLQTVRRLAV
jgi:CheY-like chemotaxis protein